jgi:hypothetical protein
MVVRLAIPQNFAEKYWQSIIINYVDLSMVCNPDAKSESEINRTDSIKKGYSGEGIGSSNPMADFSCSVPLWQGSSISLCHPLVLVRINILKKTNTSFFYKRKILALQPDRHPSSSTQLLTIQNS